MSESGPFVCPQCDHPLSGEVRNCPNCGVDLALLALLAERASLEGLQTSISIPPPSAADVPRLGEYLISQGKLSEVDLERALSKQKQTSSSKRKLLGQTLLEMELVEQATLDAAITSQIIELHLALQEANKTLEMRVSERTSELRGALERLTELNQIKANLISNVSHELRTPLAHIKGYIELVGEEQLGPINDEQSKAIGVMHRASERLGQLIEDLIEFSTASREGLSVNLQATALNKLAKDVLTRSEAKAKKAGVELEFDIEKDLDEIEADPEKIGWVLYQLVDNGIKFTPEGGSVRISGSKVGAQAMIAVIDTGIGIPKDRIEEVFEPFHQLNGSPTRRFGGTGLGMALVKQILTAHETHIDVQTEANEGTRFSFELPFAKLSP
jgi:signal transduction histidine kinase